MFCDTFIADGIATKIEFVIKLFLKSLCLKQILLGDGEHNFYPYLYKIQYLK